MVTFPRHSFHVFAVLKGVTHFVTAIAYASPCITVTITPWACTCPSRGARHLHAESKAVKRANQNIVKRFLWPYEVPPCLQRTLSPTGGFPLLQDFDERDATRAAMLKDSDWQRDYIDAGRRWLANQVRF